MNMRSYSCCSVKNINSQKIAYISSLLKIIDEENRLKILYLLKEKSHCVCEMISHLQLSQSLISHHLKDLKEAEIIIPKKKRLRIYYSLTKKGKYITSLILKLL